MRAERRKGDAVDRSRPNCNCVASRYAALVAAKRRTTTDGEIATRLRAAGLRSTAPRVAVLRALLARAAPVSHADLCGAMELDRATIYRNLIDLTEAGLASRIDLGDHVWRFEVKRLVGDHVATHPHFVCSECGEVRCLPDVTVRIVAGKNAPRSLASKNVAIQLTSRCDDCQK